MDIRHLAKYHFPVTNRFCCRLGKVQSLTWCFDIKGHHLSTCGFTGRSSPSSSASVLTPKRRLSDSSEDEGPKLPPAKRRTIQKPSLGI